MEAMFRVGPENEGADLAASWRRCSRGREMAEQLRLDVGYLTQLSMFRNSAPFGNGVGF